MIGFGQAIQARFLKPKVIPPLPTTCDMRDFQPTPWGLVY